MSVAYGYCRVSDDKQVDDGMSLDVQKRLVHEKFAELEKQYPGLQWGGHFVDPAVSASKVMFLQREAGAALQARLKKGDWVIVANLDRIFRDLADTVTMNTLWIKRGINPCYMDIPVHPTDRMFITWVTLKGIFSQQETNNLSDRVKKSIAEKRARGEAISRRPPIGFKFKFGHRPGEQKWTKFVVPDPDYDKLGEWVIDMRCGGWSWAKIAAIFNENKIRTSHQERWTWESVQRLWNWAREKGLKGNRSWQSQTSVLKPSAQGWKRPKKLDTSAGQSTSSTSPDLSTTTDKRECSSPDQSCSQQVSATELSNG